MNKLYFPPLEEIDYELATRDLYQFVKLGWSIVEPGNTYKDGWHIEAICEHLRAVNDLQIRNLIINIPPRHMKSLLVCVFWFVWTWIHNPQSRWMYSSYSEDLAIRDSLKCRRVIQSYWYQTFWGDKFYLSSDQNVKSRFENNHLGYRMASGIGGMATGEGGDYLVVDDPLKERDAHSPVRRKAVNDWWDNTMSTRGNDPQTVRKVMIMQRLHQEDLTGHVLEKMREGGEHYEYLCLPAEYEHTRRVTGIGWVDPRKKVGTPLWVDRFPLPEIKKLHTSLSAYAIAGQLQQRPSPDIGGIFKKVQWRYWVPEGIILPPVDIEDAKGNLHRIDAQKLPTTFDQIIQSWDLAFKDAITNDYICGIVVGVCGFDRYLLDMYKERADINETLVAIKAMTNRWPLAYLKLIEDKANGSAVMDLLRDVVSGMVPVNPLGGKVGRAHAASPAVESGHVFLPHPLLSRWVDNFIESCAGFPNLAHDDDVDAFTQAINYLQDSQVLIGVG